MDTIHSLPKREFMPHWAFHLMRWSMKINDLFSSPDAKLDGFDIKPGNVVIDYGCGPGRYLRRASELVGTSGKVFAVDIHDIAFKCACRYRTKKNMRNIYPVKAIEYFAPIPENKADIIYALDMFHQVSNTEDFLNELHRLIKPDGKLILEDGHQKRATTLQKVKTNGRWEISFQHKKHLVLNPLYKQSNLSI